MHEGPIGRAYLATLRQLGFRPETLILMVYRRAPGTGKRVGRWFPPAMRTAYAQAIQEGQSNFWARRLLQTNHDLVRSMMRIVRNAFGLPEDFYEEVLEKCDYTRYSDQVQPILVDGLGDERLSNLLSGMAPNAVLFTGGGILPKSLLEIPGLRFLHIHPGYLPHVRGADGLLWSTLIRGRPGATCMYMGSGIDDGDIVLREEFEPLAIEVPESERPSDQDLYRAIYAYYDPVVRAQILRQMPNNAPDLASLYSKPQDPESGSTYQFMNRKLRHAAVAHIFPNKKMLSLASRSSAKVGTSLPR